MPMFRPGDDPGSSFPELLRRARKHLRRYRRGTLREPRLGAARHDVRRPALRRRRRHGRRPAGHRRQPDHPPGDGEGRRGRPAQRRRDRRRGRPGDGDGQAVPAPARALREGRGDAAQPRGQGEPAVDDGARQPPRGDAGHGRRADLRRLRPAPRPPAGCGTTTSRAAATRRSDYVATGSGSLHAGTVIKLGYAADQTATRRSSSSAGRCGRPPTPTRPPAAPTRCGGSTRSSPTIAATASPVSPTTSWRPATRRSPNP